MIWKDISSYSREEKRTEPKTFEANVYELRLIITRHIHYEPELWLFTCEPFFDLAKLQSTKIDEAQAEAVHLLRLKMEHICSRLR